MMKYILAASVLLMCLYLGYAASEYFGQKSIRKENRSLKGQLDSLQGVYKALEKENESILLKIDSISMVARARGKKINDFKKIKHEKVIAIDSFNSDELTLSFSRLKP